MLLGGVFRMWYHVQWRTPRASCHAGVAQLVEYLPSKQGVAGSSPVSRSMPLEIRRGVAEKK